MKDVELYAKVRHAVRIEGLSKRAVAGRFGIDGDNLGQGLHGPVQGSGGMTDTPQVLLAHHLKALKLPTFLREYDKVARQCAAESADYPRYLLRLAELELIDRDRRMGGASHQGGQVPDREEPRQLRLRGVAILEQGAGDGAGAIGVRRARTSSRSATAAPARAISAWGWVLQPARRVCRSGSRPPPPLCTN